MAVIIVCVTVFSYTRSDIYLHLKTVMLSRNKHGKGLGSNTKQANIGGTKYVIGLLILIRSFTHEGHIEIQTV